MNKENLLITVFTQWDTKCTFTESEKRKNSAFLVVLRKRKSYKNEDTYAVIERE